MMKRLLAMFLTSCMIVGLASPAGSGAMNGLLAGAGDDVKGTEASEARTESAAEGAGNFDQSIRDLYENSMSVTDEEVLASAEMMNSDFAAVESIMGESAEGLVEYLKYYEAAKSNYIGGFDRTGSGFSGYVTDEWDRQGEYTSYVMPATDKIFELVPRIKVNECTFENGSADLDIYEWMTVGYAPDSDSAVNAAAYGYNFSLRLECDGDGNWQIASVGDTDQNFDWMAEEAEYSVQTQQESSDSLRAFSEDGEKEMMAAVAAGSYTYNVSKAIAYADKYCINYNSAYNSYKGRGGDCANFVSQCLYNGGFPQDSTWYKHSVAWINVMKQIAYFKKYGTFMNATNGNILTGNPIYFDWNGDSTYDHATICVGRNNSGTAILDSHTTDLYHATWNNWSFKKAATIQLRSSGTASSTSSEGGTWKSNSVGYWYEYGDGTYLKSCWKYIDKYWYYFNSSGYALTGLQKIGSSYFYFDPSSCKMKTGWVTVNGKTYYFDSNGYGCTEWEEIGGKWYYFNPSNCEMVKGFYKVGNKLHYFNADGVEQFGWITVSGKKYFLDEYGVVQFGWQTLNGKKYYFDTNGAMVTGVVNIDGVIYDFDNNGCYVGKSAATAAPTVVNTTQNTTTYNNQTSSSTGSSTSSSTESSTSTSKTEVPATAEGKTGWVQYGSSWAYYNNGKAVTGWFDYKGYKYYFSSDGVMVTGWNKIGGKWYYFTDWGNMKIGWFKDGDKWYYLQSNGVMKTGWLKYGTTWYYLNADGAMRADSWLKLNNKWYYFGSSGAMKTGWAKIDGTWYYMNSDGDMRTGWLKYKNNWYYLNSYGAMVTGKNSIDGRTYYFNSQGVMS